MEKLEFNCPEFLQEALTHRSWANEKGIIYDNERFEFLGDAVLSFVITDYLFSAFPQLSEGDLARLRSAIVSTTSLAKTSLKLGLGDRVLLSKGEISTGGSQKESILADVLEAVIGAVFLDGGIEKASKFILENHKEIIEEACSAGDLRDSKTQLQEFVQKEMHLLPDYRVVKEKGPDHRKWFVIETYVGSELWGVGEGSTKKQAQQNAATQALLKLRTRGNINE